MQCPGKKRKCGHESTHTERDDAAQMVMPRINGKDLADPAYRLTIDDLVKEGMGGFILFGGDIDQTPRRLQELPVLCGGPPP